jgi:hypothetical protein
MHVSTTFDVNCDVVPQANRGGVRSELFEIIDKMANYKNIIQTVILDELSDETYRNYAL